MAQWENIANVSFFQSTFKDKRAAVFVKTTMDSQQFKRLRILGNIFKYRVSPFCGLYAFNNEWNSFQMFIYLDTGEFYQILASYIWYYSDRLILTTDFRKKCFIFRRDF